MKLIPAAIIFDFDGTIVDSERATFEIASPILSKYLGRMITGEEFNNLKGKVWKREFEKWLPVNHSRAYNEIVRKWEATDHDIPAYEGVLELLSLLKSRGVGMGIASSRETGQITELLEKLKIEAYFGAVIGQNDTSRHKPDPDPLNLAADIMRVDRTRCIYIGDQLWDIMAAKSAGMISGAALWGEGDGDVLSQAQPDYLFKKPCDVLKAIFPENS